jgi:hypothetical protein
VRSLGKHSQWRQRRLLLLATLGVAVLGFAVGRALGAAPAAGAATSAATTVTASPPPRVPAAIGLPAATPKPRPATHAAQDIRADAVQIEGKLYSPQALYIVQRVTERFGRDAVVPHTLAIEPGTALAPYRVREAALRATVPAAR